MDKIDKSCVRIERRNASTCKCLHICALSNYVTPPDRHIIILFVVKIWDGPIQYNMYYVKLSYASMYVCRFTLLVHHVYIYVHCAHN